MLSAIKSWYRFLNPKFQSVHLDYRVSAKPRYEMDSGGHPKLMEIINQHDEGYEHLLTQVLSHHDIFSTWETSSDGKDVNIPQWGNRFFPALDMMCLYTVVHHYRPKRVIEVGSGNSTKVIKAAVQNGGINTEITSIDPKPRTEINHLSDHIVRKRLEEYDVSEVTNNLNPGDILFIDNSHHILPNSDAMVVFTEILPHLQIGVLVHIHDIYIPYDYPQFMCDRFYSEQYGLMIALLSNPNKYQPLLPVYYVSQHMSHQETIQDLWTLPLIKEGEKHGGSFWFTISA